MAQTHFTNLLIVVVAAFAAPFALGLAPWLRLPAVVLEIVAGIAIGPSGLGWVQIDAPVEILSLIGLAFLLFLAGLEIDARRLRGRTLGSRASGSSPRWSSASSRGSRSTPEVSSARRCSSRSCSPRPRSG